MTKNKYIVLTIILALVLLTAVAVIASWFHIKATSSRLQQVSDQYQMKTDLILHMWDIARVRESIIQKMLVISDPFKLDELNVEHKALSGRYFNERVKLNALPMSSVEIELLSTLGEAVKNSANHHARMSELILDEKRLGEANELIMSPSYIEARSIMFRNYEELFGYYRNMTRTAIHHANAEILNDIKLILMLTAMVLLFSATVGYIMVRKAVVAERQLQEEVERRLAIQAELEKHQQHLEEESKNAMACYKASERAREEESRIANEALEASARQVMQAEKLASVGQLAAGIAHEINTPIQFVGDNILFLQDSCDGLIKLVQLYETLNSEDTEPEARTNLGEKARNLSEEVEVDYLAEEMPRTFRQSMEGVERITGIVRSMKDFSHPGSDSLEYIDINHAIESTINVSRNEWKYVAEVITDFDHSLKAVPCYPGQLNQVFLNIIVNAAHAIADVRESDDELGTISVSTRLDDTHFEVRIEYSGAGMSEDVRNRIFDPFFTTKGVGKGTGQGLAIAYSVVVEQHKGSIDVRSTPGKGTTFILRLPMNVESEDAGVQEESCMVSAG